MNTFNSRFINHQTKTPIQPDAQTLSTSTYQASIMVISLFISLFAYSSHVFASTNIINKQPTKANQHNHDSANKNLYLPPIKPWQGKSEQLIVSKKHPWITPAEKSDLTDTPNYKQTFLYLNKLVASDKRLNKISIGKSPQGRDIWMVIANHEGINTAEELRQQNKPTLLVQAGIHSGEIDGKDAGLMLLRDIIHNNKSNLLRKVNLLFVPILSVDGHERQSAFNRVNQRGPTQMGWRTNAQNLNLNRDYAKLDTLELQHMIRAINIWQPDLYYDVHVTDGADYQYDITYGFTGQHGDSSQISRWLSQTLSPQIDQALNANGHVAGPLVFGVDSMEFSKGIAGWTASPRYSNGYGDVRQLPTILIENHSLKPYKQRVLGTYIMIEQTLKLLAKQGDTLRAAIQQDKAKVYSIKNKNKARKQIVSWTTDMDNLGSMDFAGIEYKKAYDKVLGLNFIQWTGEPKTYKNLPIYQTTKPKVSVDVAKNYWLPAQYLTVIERLNIHGIKLQTLQKPLTIKATQLIAHDVKLSDQAFEGHQMASASFKQKQVEVTLPAGTIKVSTQQPLAKLVVALLDPRAPDSFFSWGFFNQMFQRTEYIESYALIPLAREMLANNKKLLTEFKQKKSDDKAFAENPRAQMQWFYQRSKFYDQEYLKYPVLLEY
jgi:hypothetical protein